MTQLRVSIVGAGKRVLETALPALRAARSDFAIHGIFARSERSITLDDSETIPIRTLESFEERDLSETDVFYVAVGKGAIGSVLAALTRFDVSKKTLWIDTPVLLWKQVHHLAKIERFGKAEVPEDCIALPWYDVVEKLRAQRGLPPPQAVTFFRSAYKYHGLAMAKTLLHDGRILSGTVKAGGPERVDPGGVVVRGNRIERTRTLRFSLGGRATVYEPREYASGFVVLGWESLLLADVPTDSQTGSGSLVFELTLDHGRVTAFRAGDAGVELDDAERGLQRLCDPGLGLTARMEDWKRIGFLRLLRRLARGQPGYPALAGIDDSLVDWQLDKFGRYRRNPLTTIDRGSARLTLGAISRLLG